MAKISKVFMHKDAYAFVLFLLFGVLITAECFSALAQIEVSADQSLEWHERQGVYIARGNAKAIRADITVSADLLTAHKRKTTQISSSKQSGDIDRMTAEGNVVITKGAARITGDMAVHDFDSRTMLITGDNLRYETDAQVVTAKESLEYHEETQTAVARGKATATSGDRRITGDVLTAVFRDQPNGKNQLHKLTATGNVIVLTKNDIVRGNKGVYDASRNVAVITGNVRITRPDGTELMGDIAEADFASNRSRLLNDGSGRVRALLPAGPVQGSTNIKGF